MRSDCPFRNSKAAPVCGSIRDFSTLPLPLPLNLLSQLEEEERRGRGRGRHQSLKGHFSGFAGLKGACQSSSTARPEYCRASDCSPKSLNIGLVLPCNWKSRVRI